MNKSTAIALLTLCAVVVLIGGSYILYNFLEPRYYANTQEESAQVDKNESTESTGSETEKVPYVDIVGEDANGNVVALSDYIGAECVVVNFWASWCSWCGKEMPEFYEVSQEYADDGVVFVMVNMTDGRQETKEDGIQYLEQGGFPFENVIYDVNGEASAKYEITGLPTTIFIDKEGNVVSAKSGAMGKEELTGTIDKIIGNE